MLERYTLRVANSQDETCSAFCKAVGMKEPFERLQEARKKAGFDSAPDAARAFGWIESTYFSHENGARGLRPPTAEKYAKALRTTPEWLLYGKGKSPPKSSDAPEGGPREIDLVGYVGAGSRAFFEPAGHLGTVTAPFGASEATVAVEIRGDSLGSSFDGWVAFYDDIRRPVTDDQLNRLCVVGLFDGQILVKTIKRARGKGLFHLLSDNATPITDVEIEWAARVRAIVPRGK
jgi:hypothetical protein